jgi:hypothetical protein
MGSVANVNVKSTVFMCLIMLSLIWSTSIGYKASAFKETATSYSDGYSKGHDDAVCDFNICHDHGYDPSCPSGHTERFCSGYSAGYENGWTSGGQSGGSNNSPSTNTDSKTQSISGNGANSGGNNNDDNANQASDGQTSSEQQTSSTEGSTSSNGEINWTDKCQLVQLALYQSCDELVNSDGSLTGQGQHAFHCIRNGALLGGGVKLLVPVAPTGLIIKGLEKLAGPTGCDGIVKLDALGRVSGLGSIINFLP